MTEKTKTGKGKQKPEVLYEMANELVAEYGQRDRVLDELEPYYFLDGEQDPDNQPDDEGVEVVRLPYAGNVIDLVQDLIGATTLGITVPALSEKEGDKKLADAAEAFLRCVLEQSERAQRQSLLGRVAWLVAMRGCVAGRAMGVARWVEKDEGDQFKTGKRVPILIQLRDPRYVYPAFGLDGLSYVVEQRERTVRDIRQSLGDDMLEGRSLKDKVTWTEFWDDTYYCYWVDGSAVGKGTEGKVTGPWPHEFGGIPYAFEFARQSGRVEPHKRVRPLLGAMKGVIDRLQLLDSAEATFILDYNGDTLNIFTQDTDRPYSKESGAVNYMDPEDKVEWLRASRQPLETEMAYNKYTGVLQKGTFPESLYGIDPGRIMAGYAINLLNQSGQARLTPILTCIERFLGSLFESCLMVSESWLSKLVAGPIPFYVFNEAQSDEGAKIKQREERKLDATQLGGFYSVEVQLGEVLPADEQSNIVLAGRMREPGADGRPMLSWETVVTKFKLAEDATDERDRIDREMAWNDPRVQELRRAILTAEILEELGEDLQKLDIDPVEVLARAGLGPEPQPEGPPGGMLPPEMAPPAVQGQLLPQPMGAIPAPGEEEEEFMPPPPTIPGGGMF